MLELLKYIFSSPWIFIGVVFLMWMGTECIEAIIKRIKEKP